MSECVFSKYLTIFYDKFEHHLLFDMLLCDWLLKLTYRQVYLMPSFYITNGTLSSIMILSLNHVMLLPVDIASISTAVARESNEKTLAASKLHIIQQFLVCVIRLWL